MIPRIRGKVGQADAPEEVKGKWFFEMWMTEIGGGEGKSLGIFGPFDSEAKAQLELKVAVKFVCDSTEKFLDGRTSGKYIDMKTNEIRKWGDEN